MTRFARTRWIRATLPFACLILSVAVLAQPQPQPEPAPAEAAPATIKLPEFGDVPVVAWDQEDAWVFGGDRFHKSNRYYQPMDPTIPHPWVIAHVDIKTWFQQDVIDGFAPSFEALVGDKWSEVKKFMEDKKYGGSVAFDYTVTNQKLVLYHAKGKPREARLELDVVAGGLEKFFCEPKLENFANVDRPPQEEAHKIAVERYQARLAWAGKIREAAKTAVPTKHEDDAASSSNGENSGGNEAPPK